MCSNIDTFTYYVAYSLFIRKCDVIEKYYVNLIVSLINCLAHHLYLLSWHACYYP
jgi:hypothetical protein